MTEEQMNEIMSVINEEAVENVVEEVVTTSNKGSMLKKVVTGGIITVVAAGIAYGVYTGVKHFKAKRAAKREAEIEEIEE